MSVWTDHFCGLAPRWTAAGTRGCTAARINTQGQSDVGARESSYSGVDEPSRQSPNTLQGIYMNVGGDPQAARHSPAGMSNRTTTPAFLTSTARGMERRGRYDTRFCGDRSGGPDPSSGHAHQQRQQFKQRHTVLPTANGASSPGHGRHPGVPLFTRPTPRSTTLGPASITPARRGGVLVNYAWESTPGVRHPGPGAVPAPGCWPSWRSAARPGHPSSEVVPVQLLP